LIVALAGGVGGAKLVDGLARVLSAQELVAVVNTGDDFEHLGLRVSPDLDTVMYTLAGRANTETGWGLAGETWRFMEALERLGGETWFRLGDQDLATHVCRTQMLAAGATLSEITARLCGSLGVTQQIVPMSDGDVHTMIKTSEGELAFQEYFVRRRCAPVVQSVRYAGAADALPSGAFIEALGDARLQAVVLCPSNPWLSIEPVLTLPGVRERLRCIHVPVIAVSPIVGGQAIKGPAAKIMHELGRDVSALEVAKFYGDLLDGFVLDRIDAHLAVAVADLGMEPLVTDTVMTDGERRAQLARDVIRLATRLADGASA